MQSIEYNIHSRQQYNLKSEPNGRLDLDINAAKSMGLEHLTDLELQVVTGYLMCNYVCPSLAVLALLEISVVTLSVKVESVSMSCPAKRRVMNLGQGKTTLAPVDKYVLRPTSLEHMTFTTFFQTYACVQTGSKPPPNCLEETCTSRDGSLTYYERDPKADVIVRFSNFHPWYQRENFFYGFLLERVPFTSESQLMTAGNPGKTYYNEVILRKLITSAEELGAALQPYMDHNLYSPAAFAPHVQSLLVLRDPEDAIDLTGDTTAAEVQGQLTTQQAQQEFAWTAGREFELNTEQTIIFDTLVHHHHGLHVIGGGGGCGKTFLVKKITHALRSLGLTVELAATTGAAAQRLSPNARTVHSCLGFRRETMFFQPLDTSSDTAQRILNANVLVSWGHAQISCQQSIHFIHSFSRTCTKHATLKLQSPATSGPSLQVFDEYSMMSRSFWSHVTARLVGLYPGKTIQDVFASKLILLVGDHRQLPPVCSCKLPEGEVVQCKECDMTRCPLFKASFKHRLKESVRHQNDPEHQAFLMKVRVRQPTTDEIDAWTLPHMLVEEEDLLERAQPSDRIVCSHLADVYTSNTHMLKKDSEQRNLPITPLPLHCVEVLAKRKHSDTPEILPNDMPAAVTTWLEDDRFHTIKEAIIGAPVICVAALGPSKPNGSTGVIVSFKEGTDGAITQIVVAMETGGEVKFTRTESKDMWIDGRKFTKKGFPLALAYAVTGHKIQGATITTKMFVWMREAFVPGLLYVMLSRVTERSLLHVVGRLRPEHFIPARAVRGLDDDQDVPDDVMEEA